YFGIVARSKGKEDGMVGAVWVLRGTRLAAHFNISNPYRISRSPRDIDYAAEPLDNRLIILGVDTGINLFGKLWLHDLAFANTFDEVGAVIIPPISDDSHDICHLQRRDPHLALADRQRYIKS